MWGDTRTEGSEGAVRSSMTDHTDVGFSPSSSQEELKTKVELQGMTKSGL